MSGTLSPDVIAAINKVAATPLGRKYDRIMRKKYHKSGVAIAAKTILGESGGRANAVSSAGARAWAQFMPGTRADYMKKYGVDAWRSPREAVIAMMHHHLNTGIAGYNPGMPTYTDYILGQRIDPETNRQLIRNGSSATNQPQTQNAGMTPGPMVTPGTQQIPGQSFEAERQALRMDLLTNPRGIDLKSLLDYKRASDQYQDIPGREVSSGMQVNSTAASGKTVMVGDSLGVGTNPYLQGIEADTKVGRSSASAVAALKRLVAGGDVTRVVFDVGTNDGSAAQLRKSISQARRVAKGAMLIVPTVNGPDAENKNRVLRGLADRGEIVLVDWASKSGGLLASDGIHATPTGYRARAAMLAAALQTSLPNLSSNDGRTGNTAGPSGEIMLGGGPAPRNARLRIEGPNPGRVKREVITYANKVSRLYGGSLIAVDGSTHSKLTVNGNVSEHWTGNAVDIFRDARGNLMRGDALIRAGRAALIAAGMDRKKALQQTGGLFNVGRHQIIFNTQEGGDHTDHLHISTHAG